MNVLHAYAVVNFLLCAVAATICICRLNAMTAPERKRRVRMMVVLEYVAWLGAMFYSALSPWIGEWPGSAAIVLDLAVIIGLAASRKAWRGDIPPVIATKPTKPEDL